MSYPRKTNRKTSSSSRSSSTSSSSENHHWQNLETSQPSSSGSSFKRPVYPNVPKRTRQSLFNDDDEPIQTESRINIIPSEIRSQRSEGYPSIRSSSNRNAYDRNMLDFMTKYTSPEKNFQESRHRSSSPLEDEISVLSNNQSVYGSKSKRTLSPLDETEQQMNESKRTKSFDENDDEVSQLIDHRRNRSQNNNTNILSQVTNDGEPRKATVRKPTVRKLSTNQRKPSASQPIPIERREALIIEPDNDPEDEDREETSWLTHHVEHEIINHSVSTPIIPSPVKLSLNNCIDSFDSNTKQNASFTPIHSAKDNPIDTSSPCLNTAEAGGRRFSSTSSNSLYFDTPNSSFSRTTTNNTTNSTPQIVIKNDHETQISYPSNIDMINQLISQMKLTMNDDIDYNPRELAKKFFHQSSSFSLNTKYPMVNSLINKQFFHFGRYEIEILFPSDNKNSTIYACDICLKQFSASTIAFQRHTAKCLCTQPPGKLVFHTDDLAIFQIGETHMTMLQRIYIKSLCRIVRLFMDPNQTIDDTKIDRFAYYILCRRDPILSQSQLSIYRLLGYFSKQLNQQTQQLMNNLSCLFILPPFTNHQEYYQLLIAFSYSLIQSNDSINLNYSSPARPLDILTLSAFRTYWRDSLFDYIINHNHSSIKSLALDIFARQTSTHPRDILSSLYSYGFIIPNPFDKSSVYLASHSMLSYRNKFPSLMDMNANNEKRISINKQNNNKSHDSGIEEIVLD